MLSLSREVEPVILNQAWNAFERRDDNDIPSDCRIGNMPIQDSDDCEEDIDTMHELYVRGSIRAMNGSRRWVM